MQESNDDISYEFSVLLKSGDVPTFDLIFKEYYPPLYAFASRYIPEDECEDLVQDTMIWLWENKDLLDPHKSLKSLLFTIVKNRCLNQISHKKTRQKVHVELHSKFSSQFDDPDFYIQNDLMEKLNSAIKNLPKDYKEAFEMNRYNNMTYQQIADTYNISAKTVAYRISQALRILRVELKDYLPVLVLLIILSEGESFQ